jgi:hypothetical protein
MTPEAIKAYYLDPEVVWLEAGTPADLGPLLEAGFYVLAHCGDPLCCRPAGPFKSLADGIAWSRNTLDEPWPLYSPLENSN